jgi:hypothetical protein
MKLVLQPKAARYGTGMVLAGRDSQEVAQLKMRCDHMLGAVSRLRTRARQLAASPVVPAARKILMRTMAIDPFTSLRQHVANADYAVQRCRHEGTRLLVQAEAGIAGIPRLRRRIDSFRRRVNACGQKIATLEQLIGRYETVLRQAQRGA